MLTLELTTKYGELLDHLALLRRGVIAFSGRVDSTLLLHAAQEALNKNVLAVTVTPPYVMEWEVEEALAFTKSRGIRHELLPLPFPEEVRQNPPNRCYLCKRRLYGVIMERARAWGTIHVLDGTNLDDLEDLRPGLRAINELGIRTPLHRVALTKDDVRKLSTHFKLPTAKKPAYACLMTRFPFGVTVTQEDLHRVERAEVTLMALGFRAVRVRSHGDVARIEIMPEQFEQLWQQDTRTLIQERLRALGFRFVTLDLEGYMMGSFNTSPTGEKEMNKDSMVRALLESIRDGSTSVDSGIEKLTTRSTIDLGHTTIDLQRSMRNGFPEVIYGAGKTPDQIVEIFKHMSRHHNVLATRVSPDAAQLVCNTIPHVHHNPMANTLTQKGRETVYLSGEVAIVTAGTSDLPVAEEALVTCDMLGVRANLISDVGVAGIHRLFDRLEELKRASVLIVVAGMEGALSSVVGGLVAQPIIAVPTSVGYGASFGGVSALLGMLTSCASGISVVNIDNGFGAACAAVKILNLLERQINGTKETSCNHDR